MQKAYDIIGDVHGRALELKTLLEKLGYQKRNGSYSCSDRQAIFLGDYIDRGKQNREVINIVRSMVDAGNALAILGNHEYNAICYHTRHPETGEYLRPHSQKNRDQHSAFLKEVGNDTEALQDAIDWFRQLPMYLDLGNLRVIHACWHPEEIDALEEQGIRNGRLSHDQIVNSTDESGPLYSVVETLLKGVEVPLPEGVSFLDKDNKPRTAVRIRWWANRAGGFRDMAIVPLEALSEIPNIEFPENILLGYPTEDVPVFFGHYWLTGQPKLFRNNVCCVDYSVGKPGGALCCYSWEGESNLSADNLVAVKRSA